MTPAEIGQVMAATWPPAAIHPLGPWLLRAGQGGGSRVSAATATGPVGIGDIAQAEAGMHDLGQPPLFMIRPGEEALDAALAGQGYRIKDPVVVYAIPAATLAHPAPAPLTAFPHWPPLAIARRIWADGDIGPERLAVMDRVAGPKTAVLGRTGIRSSGVAFVALHGPHAMLHALEVVPALRRQGAAANILRQSAIWAMAQGADRISLVVTAGNGPARQLYTSLGMVVVGQYHYRQK